ncbi:hypothetical protein [Burkholderia sp. IMCC1007]|uniref:hypothetical protein n=1 Tax=Burkholderia sp. IMCC1007 TaxID=3004104 RepID=UPI0022B3F945|nr:hypothetical protein [Burkholderia sp. IMCC1007]
MLMRLPDDNPNAVRFAAMRHASRATRTSRGRDDDVMRRVVCSLPGDVANDERGVLHVFACCAATLVIG